MPIKKDFDETKYISFYIKTDEQLEKYNEIRKREGSQFVYLSVILIDSGFRTGIN